MDKSLLTDNVSAAVLSHEVGAGLHAEDQGHVAEVDVPALGLHQRGHCRQVGAAHGADVEAVAGQVPEGGGEGGGDRAPGATATAAAVDGREVVELGGGPRQARGAGTAKVGLVRDVLKNTRTRTMSELKRMRLTSQ